MKAIPKKAPFKQQKQPSRLLRRLMIGFGIGFASFLAICFVWIFQSSQPFPIKRVEIIGEHPHVTDMMMVQAIQKDLKGGFFGLNVIDLKGALCNLPWIKEAVVRRVWPGKLVIHVEEHQPFGIWNGNKIITETGDMIEPESVSLTTDFPGFDGPEGKSEQIVAQWRKLNETLEKIDLKITHLELAQRGAWQLTLNNGITVRLGTHDIQSRLERFVHAYRSDLYKKAEAIDYVDLRYTIGLAVGWKRVNTQST